MTQADIASDLAGAIASIAPVDETARAAAVAYQTQLTKPERSLGRLEDLGNQLCAIAGACPPPVPDPGLAVVFAGDHGVQANAVSPWPQEITQQMALNIAAGGASINVLARNAGADVLVIDVGMLAELPDSPTLINKRVRGGTDDFTQGPAMSRDEAQRAIMIGFDAARDAAAKGYRAILTGEVGIGNTTPAAALISVFTGQGATRTTGRGAGAGDDMLQRKREVVERAIAVNHASVADPVGALAGVGGLEHAALAGLILGGAAAKLPVILDGVIACSAALVAVALAPACRGFLIASHGGAEPGIRPALHELGLEPILDLGLRLGEGSGAATALPIVQAAAKLLREMATFASAGVTSAHD